MVSSALIPAPAGCKSDDGGDGSVPTELVGKWEALFGGDTKVEFTNDGKLKSGDQDFADISVYGTTVIAKKANATIGSFSYSIVNSQLMVTTGSPLFKSLENNSPLAKQED